MIVVCPEFAIDAPMDRVALQATAFCDWSGPVFFLGGHFNGDDLERPWQTDYLHAMDAMLDAGATRYLCGSNRADLAVRRADDAARSRVPRRLRSRTRQSHGHGRDTRNADRGGRGHPALERPVTPIGSSTAIGTAEIHCRALRLMRA